MQSKRWHPSLTKHKNLKNVIRRQEFAVIIHAHRMPEHVKKHRLFTLEKFFFSLGAMVIQEIRNQEQKFYILCQKITAVSNHMKFIDIT